MPTEVYLNRYDKNMDTVTISVEEWEACVQKIEGLKLVKDDKGVLNYVEFYSKRVEDSLLIFWLDATGAGSLRQRGFFGHEEIYEKAIEIAGYLKAIIFGEEGHVLYEPHVGIIFDDCEPGGQICPTLDDLKDNKVYHDPDVKGAILWLIDRLKEISSEETE